ncbi:unnamed protein product, partial [marine sediment metagenome]
MEKAQKNVLELEKNVEIYRERFENTAYSIAVFEAVEKGQDFIIKDFNNTAEKLERIHRADLLRQIEDNEKVDTSMRVTMGAGGRNMSKSVSGNTDVQKTDMYQLEVYSTDGILLEVIPLTHFVDDIQINKDRIFLLDEKRG